MTNPELLAASVLKRIKDYYPRASKADADRTRAWARVFARQASQYPTQVYEEAIDVWAAHSSEPPTAHDVLESCKKVVGQWEADPRRREFLNEHRQARLSARIARGELPAGTTPVRARDALPGGNNGTKPDIAAFRAELKRRQALRKHEENQKQHDEDPLAGLDRLLEKHTKKES